MTHLTESAQKTENPEHSLCIFSWRSTLKSEERRPSHKVSKKENKTKLLFAHLWPLKDYALCYKYYFPKIPQCSQGNTESLNKNRSSFSDSLIYESFQELLETLFFSYLKYHLLPRGTGKVPMRPRRTALQWCGITLLSSTLVQSSLQRLAEIFKAQPISRH